MSSKSDRLTAKVLNPARARRKKFKCCACAYGSYNARDYKILFKARKIVFFLFPAASRKVYCHDCLYKLIASKIPLGEEEISIEVEDLEENYILTIEQENI